MKPCPPSQTVTIEKDVEQTVANDFMLDRKRWERIIKRSWQEAPVNSLRWRWFGWIDPYYDKPGHWFVTTTYKSRLYNFNPIRVYSGSIGISIPETITFVKITSVSCWKKDRMILNRPLGSHYVNMGGQDWLRFWWTLTTSGIDNPLASDTQHFD